ncbi:hypothetical protein A6V39_03865 [Candidatus Mycoplasma haematobovis]|uniref:Uncharacterized protein n=1 Tax=Candidatus Mycoplasma haematobovis TaxID=432608 RepID=A0A1A9QD51_9MOLU|nr:hypothetical protein [Candidatus Mycoplasma haematobovis]OAL10024.1 hypothetical protein A6V39_03865 [Candidatus Mycoplasma haematobovis]
MVNKALIISGTTAASVGVGVGGYFLFHNSSEKEQTIEKLLSLDDANKGKERLTISTKAENGWLEKWKQYIADNTTGSTVNTTDKLGVNNWASINNNKTSVPDEFARKCEELLGTKIKDKTNDKYNSYVTWCLK